MQVAEFVSVQNCRMALALEQFAVWHKTTWLVLWSV